MKGLYYEDFKIGDKFTTPAKTITEGAITIMIGLGGFTLPLFNDEEYAKTTIYKGRIAPGRMTLFLMGGLDEQLGIFDGTVIALVGIDKARIKNPLRAGDTIKVELEITGMRETKNPKHGIVIHKETCLNHRGEIVLEEEVTHLMMRKPNA
ncbi:MaoC/PaaZ C-terminal domain-containing protein [Chloroflexota bacterium]